MTMLLGILAAYLLLFGWEFGCAFRRSRRATRAANFDAVRKAAADYASKGWATTDLTWRGPHPYLRLEHPTEGEWMFTTGPKR